MDARQRGNPSNRQHTLGIGFCLWNFPLFWFFCMNEQSFVLGFEEKFGGSNRLGRRPKGLGLKQSLQQPGQILN